MRVGGRWPFGAPAPRGLPEAFVAELRAAERAAGDDERGGSWTLTWLEGRPVAELDGGRRVGDAPHGPDGAAPDADGASAGDEHDDELFPAS